MNTTSIIASAKSWIEGPAVEQLNKTASLNGIVKAVGLPDLHPGRGMPIGAAFMTKDIIYPHIIGNDIGCGMSLFASGIAERKAKVDRWVSKLETVKSLSKIDVPNNVELDSYGDGLRETSFNNRLGHIGGGNHFAEFQTVEEIFDEACFRDLNLDKKELYLLVHSGSGSYGKYIMDWSIRKFKSQNGLLPDSEEGQLYLSEHNNAVKWASVNRLLVALKLLASLSFRKNFLRLCVNLEHNSISEKFLNNERFFIHRKGAAPADKGTMIIPGSRGSLCYLVMPAEDTSSSAFSLAHGAGRKWERGTCKGRISDMYNKDSIQRTKLKGRVVCHDKKLLFEEAPEAYKNIERVIEDLEDAGLVKRVAAFRPVLTYKG
ncbi:MAG: RNA ligase RtcB family protein [bacterium]|nr:RNA ligase RtcB family protein [bacterium]